MEAIYDLEYPSTVKENTCLFFLYETYCFRKCGKFRIFVTKKKKLNWKWKESTLTLKGEDQLLIGG